MWRFLIPDFNALQTCGNVDLLAHYTYFTNNRLKNPLHWVLPDLCQHKDITKNAISYFQGLTLQFFRKFYSRRLWNDLSKNPKDLKKVLKGTAVKEFAAGALGFNGFLKL